MKSGKVNRDKRLEKINDGAERFKKSLMKKRRRGVHFTNQTSPLIKGPYGSTRWDTKVNEFDMKALFLFDPNNSTQGRNLAETTKSRTNLRRNGQNRNISFSEIVIFHFFGESGVSSSVGMFLGRFVRVLPQDKVTVLVNRWSFISPKR